MAAWGLTPFLPHYPKLLSMEETAQTNTLLTNTCGGAGTESGSAQRSGLPTAK